ncbi:MAG: arylsulfatase [Aureliella sp.]
MNSALSNLFGGGRTIRLLVCVGLVTLFASSFNVAGCVAGDGDGGGRTHGRGSVSEQPHRVKATRPNIIVILADDMGYSDLGCTGAEIHTPNIDDLARNGVLFTHCYNTSRCCPTRAALLTGQYQWDAGLGHMTSTKSDLPEYSRQLNRSCATIAELLERSGYQTFMSGKWHLGDKRDAWPDRRGFQQFYGSPMGGGLYFYPSKFYNRPLFRNGEAVEPQGEWYSTDAFTDATTHFLRTERDRDKPFFIYLAYIAPHFPLQAKEADIGKYKDTYQAGYEAIRRERFRKQQQSGLVPTGLEMPAGAFDWRAVENQKQEARKMAVYAAQVDCLDQNVGKLMATLKEEKLHENTLVLFLSDNGGCSNSFNKTPMVEIGGANSNAAYGKWHNVSNTPYRKAKSQEHEGGIVTPMVASWPAGIVRSNRLIHAPIHVMDLMPTFLRLADVDYPDTFRGYPLDPLDGIDFWPLVAGEQNQQGRILYWEHEGNRAVRQGDWKLVSLRKRNWELYDLSTDPFEQRDLAESHPEKVVEFKRLYRAWTKEHGVQPWPLRK